MLTPQAIKDQEFQIKFRGYDAIEVKAYLELLAEDFFEVTERNRVLTEEVETLRAEKIEVEAEKEALVIEVKEGQDSAEGVQFEIEKEHKNKDQEIDELKTSLKESEERGTALAEEIKSYQELVEELEGKVAGAEDGASRELAQLEKLKAKVELLEEQKSELKREEVDFKTTILAAQNFSDNLRETTEKAAKKLMEDAEAEVEAYRSQAEVELSRLPIEIEALEQRKTEVRDELMGVLQTYLDGLDVFPDDHPVSLA